MAKEKKSVALEHKYVQVIEAQAGDNFSVKLETLIRHYCNLLKEKPQNSIDLDQLQDWNDPDGVDSMFKNQERVFSKLSDANDKKIALELLRRPVDDSTESGYGLSPLEVEIDKISAMAGILESLKANIKVLSEVSKVNSDPVAFKAKLIHALESNDEEIVTRIMEMFAE